VNYGRYQVIEEIGQGLTGLVYRAHDPQLNREVAVKVLRRDRITGEEFVSRFLKDVRVIGQLSHPNIVAIYDAGQEGPDLYMAMEFIEGSPLNDLLRIISLSVERTIEIGIQAAQTLDYAHQKGVVHGGIKPGNILLKPDKNIIVTDFGIALIQAAADALQTRQGEIMGASAYLSPEQVQGKAVDGRADIFSLGAVLYELTTGRRPFGGLDGNVFDDIIHQDPREPASISDEVTRDLSSVIMKCLRKEPGERYQTGKELARALKACQPKTATGELAAPPAEEKPPEEKKEEKKKSYLIPAAIAAAVVLLLAAGGYFYYQRTDHKQPETVPKRESLSPATAPSPITPLEAKKTAPAEPGSALAPSPEASKVAEPAAVQSKPEPDIPRQKEKKSPVVVAPGQPSQKSSVKKQAPAGKDVKPSVAQTPVTILSTPPGASAYIDEKLRGKTPMTLMLPVGKHNLRISLPGYQDLRKAVTVEETMEYPLSFQLKSGGESD